MLQNFEKCNQSLQEKMQNTSCTSVKLCENLQGPHVSDVNKLNKTSIYVRAYETNELWLFIFL